MRHVYRCPVRWDDLDAFNHVNNVTFLEYFQDARVDFARAQGFRREAHEASIVVHQEIDYVRPLPFRPEPVDVEIRVVHIRPTSFTVAYEIRAEGAVYARGRSTQVAFDLGAQRPRRLTGAERAALERFLEPDPG